MTDGNAWLCEKLGYVATPYLRVLVGLRDGQINRAIGYDNWTGSMCEMFWAGDGWTPRFLAASFYYPFVQEGCSVVTARVAEDRPESFELVKRLGFEKVLSITDGHPSGVLHVFILRRENCKLMERYYDTHASRNRQDRSVSEGSARSRGSGDARFGRNAARGGSRGDAWDGSRRSSYASG